jgi:hypothetical protein
VIQGGSFVQETEKGTMSQGIFLGYGGCASDEERQFYESSIIIHDNVNESSDSDSVHQTLTDDSLHFFLDLY